MDRGNRLTAPSRRSTENYTSNEKNGMADSSPRLYVDANAFIYVIEGEEALAKPIQNVFLLLKDRPGLAITNELTIAEVLPKARMREQRQALLDLIVWSG